MQLCQDSCNRCSARATTKMLLLSSYSSCCSTGVQQPDGTAIGNGAVIRCSKLQQMYQGTKMAAPAAA